MVIRGRRVREQVSENSYRTVNSSKIMVSYKAGIVIGRKYDKEYTLKICRHVALLKLVYVPTNFKLHRFKGGRYRL